jgi:hypothetical protein
MATVTKKNFEVQYRGAAPLAINSTNFPWLDKVLKIYRSSVSPGLVVQSCSGAYGGATVGGAVSQIIPKNCYRIVAGIYNGWDMPDFVMVDEIDPNATGTTHGNKVLPPLVCPAGETLTYFNEEVGIDVDSTPTVAFSQGAGSVELSFDGGNTWAALGPIIAANNGFLVRVQHPNNLAATATITLTF